MESQAKGAGSILGVVIFVFIAYIAGRWQFNRAGDLIDAEFKNHPRAVAGATALASGLFSNEILPGHPFSSVIAGVGVLLIAEDALNSFKDKYINQSLGINDQPVDLSGTAPVVGVGGN